MSTQESDNLFKHMRFLEALKLYAMQFILKLKFSLRSFEIILIILVFMVGLKLIVSVNYVNEYFAEQTRNVMKNTAMNLSMIEEEMTKSLINASIATQETFLRNPNFSQEDLYNLSNKMQIKTISILNKEDGLFFLTSDRLFSKDDRDYKNFSVIDLKQCETQICGNKPCRTENQIQNCKMKRQTVLNAIKNPDQMFSLPFYKVPIYTDNKTYTPAKWVISYNKQSGKIFDLFYSGEDIINIINSNLNAHKGYINYIAITDGNGNLIAETGETDKNSMQISMPYGEKWSFYIEGKRVDYSYILKMEFDVAKQIAILRWLFIIITISVIILIIIIRIRFYDKDKSINKKDREIYDKDRAIQILETKTPMITKRTK